MAWKQKSAHSGVCPVHLMPGWPCRRCRREHLGDRVAGGCLAMSRFLVFVWMEAVAMDMGAKPGEVHMPARSWVLRGALERGLLRLEWPNV